VTPARSASIRSAGAALLALAALALCFYAPVLLGGRTLLLRDLYTQFQGPRWWYRQSLLAGELPCWNPYISCGVPFLANPQNSVLYPFSLVFLALPFGPGLAVYAALHSVLLGFFTYLLGRGLGLGFWGSLLAGIIAGFAGLPLKQVEFPEMIGGLAWTPLVLLGAWKCLTDPRWRWPALLGAALGLQLLAGSPYPPLYSALGLAAAAAVAVGIRTARRGLGFLVLGGSLGLLVGCAQYVPTLLLVRGVPASEMIAIMQPAFSLRLRDALDFVSPWLAGFPNWQKCFAVGLTTLFFAGMALGPRRTRPDASPARLGGRALAFCLLLVVTGWIFSRGYYWGIDQAMAGLPLLRRAAKWPTMGLSLSVLGLGLLAGAGLQRWLESRRPERAAGWLAWLGPLGCVTAALAVDAARGGAGLAWIREHLREPMVVYRSSSLAAVSSLAPEAARLAVAGGLAAALVWAGLRGILRRALAPAACLLAAAELFSAGRALNFQAPADLYAEPAPADLRLLLGDHYEEGASRVLVPKSFSNFSDLTYGSQVPGEFRILRSLFNQDTVMSWRVFTTQGGGSVELPDYAYRLQPLLDALAIQGSPAARRVLGAWNITVLLKGSLDASGLHAEVIPNDQVLPRARLVEPIVEVPTAADALAAIAHNQWDPGSVLAARDQHLPEFPGGEGSPGAVASTEYGPAGIRVACAVGRPCLLVLAENWADGWSARVDGAPATLYRVNYLQQAVKLGPGRHEVTFHYTAPGALWGFLLAGLGVCGIGCCALIRRES
jgi:hypothetical protein